MATNKITPEKEEALKKEYLNSPEKDKMSFPDYIDYRVHSDTNFVPWLFDFEEGEGSFASAFTIERRDEVHQFRSKLHKF